MNLEEYNERLNILLEQEIITTKSYELAVSAFKELLKELNLDDVKQAEMLFTHLPMALERCKDGNMVEGPGPEVMNEIFQSAHFPIAQNHIKYLEENWGNSLPDEEKNYLYMHYTTLLNLYK